MILYDVYDMMYDIYSNWVSTQWQWSVDLYKNRKEKAIYKRETAHKTIQRYRIHKIENKNTNKTQTDK